MDNEFIVKIGQHNKIALIDLVNEQELFSFYSPQEASDLTIISPDGENLVFYRILGLSFGVFKLEKCLINNLYD